MTSNPIVEPWSISSAVVKGQRDQLIKFWLSCPDDSLSGLWSSQAGQATREMIAQLSPTTFFTDSQVSLRTSLGQFLQAGFQQPGSAKAVIVTFLLSPPGQFRIVNPESHLPSWLVPSYRALYEQGNISESSNVSNNVSPTVDKSDVDSASSPNLEVTPQFGEFPSSLGELLNNRLQLNRLLGLSNLYYIDPDDAEIREELLGLRRKFSSLLLSSSEQDLENAFSSDFADRYWALVRSGIQSVPLAPSDESIKEHVKQKLNPAAGGGFGTPGSVAAFLVAMTLYVPGTMQVDNAEQKIPIWLLEGYKQIFGNALNP